MPGFLLHLGAIVTCTHSMPATPIVPNLRVMVNGMPTVTLANAYAVASGPGGCLNSQYVRGAVRVMANGAPMVQLDSQAISSPTGVPLVPLWTQTRVTGT